MPKPTSTSLPAHSTKNPQTTASKSKPADAIDKNDVVGNIINSINMQSATTTNTEKHALPKVYSIHDFFNRIILWKYDWMEEQQRYQLKKTPPIIGPNELYPIVDKFKSYDDYYKTMFPLLLLETWEEISNAWRENHAENERRRSSNVPIWLKAIENFDKTHRIIKFVFQSNFLNETITVYLLSLV